MKYRVKSGHCSIAPDSYVHGEDPSRERYDDIYLSGEEFDSIDRLLSRVAGFFGEDYSPEYWLLLPDSFGGKPSLQTDILVNEDERKATESEIESWKTGKLQLYNVHIFLIVEVFEESHLFSEEDADMAGIEVY